ncbi:head GIN domain-containing protein [Catalinimonas niigatensis]|uniref:head GIN domain-containing protein n=1 Tax=Catalinimonas niigatensis TaxID=1397264 RepID=UPI0026663334|nr:head GIN domain-containing protein [Catalinimonas niigatensis]WPP51420.1 head GIN domain-containing protein [Catalinimonas niigatensis]
MEDFADCTRKNGVMSETEYSFDPLHGIEVWDGLDVILHPSQEQKVVVKAGKNILPKIQLEEKEGMLTIRDQNTCNWNKSYESREVHLFLPKINMIIQNGYGHISSRDTIFSDSLLIEARVGSGSIDLMVNATQIEVVSSRYGTIILSGTVNTLDVKYLSNNAIFDGRSLKAEHTEIFHKSNNDFHLFPVHSLKGKLLMRGNAYLYKIPEEIDVEDTGQGEIIYLLQD